MTRPKGDKLAGSLIEIVRDAQKVDSNICASQIAKHPKKSYKEYDTIVCVRDFECGHEMGVVCFEAHHNRAKVRLVFLVVLDILLYSPVLRVRPCIILPPPIRFGPFDILKSIRLLLLVLLSQPCSPGLAITPHNEEVVRI